MLDFLFRPIRSALGSVERDASAPIVEGEREILDVVNAIHRATDSIERHVEVIERLATSIDPLKESVNQLTATMSDLVGIVAPMGAAEQQVEHASDEVRHFLGFRRHKHAAAPQRPPAPTHDAEGASPAGEAEHQTDSK
ncbi:hypothetical protein AYO39_01860 [Actinobacteria bacterium SCGC AG-212-D09]|nr:hypothetical protein AYO39_01860 [Actinobacteria bacterium SCGC AG-212-D09]